MKIKSAMSLIIQLLVIISITSSLSNVTFALDLIDFNIDLTPELDTYRLSSTDPQQDESRSGANDTSSIDAELDALVAEMKAKAKSDIDTELDTELNGKSTSDSTTERFLSSLYTSTDFEASASSKNSSKTSDRNKAEKAIDQNQREFINYMNALTRASVKNATGFTLNPTESEQSSSDDSTSWKILETIRPVTSSQEVPPPLVESSPEGLSSLYSGVSYPLPIPIMMQIPVSYDSGGGKESKAGCMKMVDMCKDVSKAKYSNDGTGGMMPSSSNNCQNSPMDKKYMMDMMGKMEEMMNSTMRNYMDKMMTSKVEKAMKMAMSKMKGSQNMNPKMSPKMKPSYMTNMMMNMMDMDKSSKDKSSKCPPCPKMDDREDKPDGKDDKEKESKDSYSGDDKNDSNDEDGEDAYAMDSMKEAMKDLVVEMMKDTMSQMMSTMPGYA